MKFNEKYQISKEFEDLFAFNSEEEEIEHDANILTAKFLDQLEKAVGEKIKKKDLAEALGKSASFITQLYRGDKLVNLTLLAKIQKAFNITFDIKASSNTQEYIGFSNEIKKIPKHYGGCPAALHLSWVNQEPDYSKSEEYGEPRKKTDKTDIIAAA